LCPGQKESLTEGILQTCSMGLFQEAREPVLNDRDDLMWFVQKRIGFHIFESLIEGLGFCSFWTKRDGDDKTIMLLVWLG